MKYFKLTYPDINNGLGCRVTVWITGCKHNCKGCHNPTLQNFQLGKDWNDQIKQKLYDILSLPYIKGVTFSGGDPLYSVEDLVFLCKEIKQTFPEKDIWVYTGFEFEYVKHFEIMKYIDVLCDGPFMERLKDTSLPFRGSSNQRLIDVPASLKSGKIILFNN